MVNWKKTIVGGVATGAVLSVVNLIMDVKALPPRYLLVEPTEALTARIPRNFIKGFTVGATITAVVTQE